MAKRVARSAILNDISTLTTVLCSHLRAPQKTLIGRSICIKLSLETLQRAAIACNLCATILGRLEDQQDEDIFEDSRGEAVDNIPWLHGQALEDYFSRLGIHRSASQTNDITLDFKICRPGDSRSDKRLVLHEAVGVCIVLPDRRFIALTRSTGPAAWRHVWREPDLDVFERPLPVISHWLDECRENHPLCAAKWEQDTVLPTRLIEICNGGLQAKLVETSTTPDNGTRPQYVALSYCWGAVDVLKTQRNTYQHFLVALPILQLPRTIQDAIRFSHKLGVQYLWVDSICASLHLDILALSSFLELISNQGIIQDDKNDWEEQALRMAAVYQNAYLTLIATSSKNANEGLCPTAGNKIQTAIVRANDQGPDADILIRVPDEDCFGSVGHKWDRDPTTSRAWIFQETVLSLRALHFMKDQVLWQCQTHTTSEDGLWTGDMFNENRDRLWDHLETWRSWVQNYSRRTLTNPEDRFASMAGVVEYFHSLSGYTFRAGIWEETFPFELLWIDTGTKQALPESWRGIPSWSWMKSTGGVVDYGRVLWTSRDIIGKTVVCICELKDFNITWRGRPLVTQPSRGCLRLRARIVPAKIIYDWHYGRIEPTVEQLQNLAASQNIAPTDPPWNIHRSAVFAGKWCIELKKFHPDLEEPAKGATITLMEVVSYRDKLGSGESVIYHQFLWVEEATGLMAGEFRRLGYGAVYSNFDFFLGSGLREISLV